VNHERGDSPTFQAVMSDSNSLTLAWQQDETSKEAGDNSMTVKPLCGDLEIPKSQRQGEEPKAKAKLPEPQTHTGGSHSLPIPDKEQSPHDTRSLRLNERTQPGDGAGNKPDNGRTGRLQVHHHHDSRTTGSPAQEPTSCMATEPPYYPTCPVNAGCSQPRTGRGLGITNEQSEGKPKHHGEREAVRTTKKNVSMEDNQC
jgi:hypothetical protein